MIKQVTQNLKSDEGQKSVVVSAHTGVGIVELQNLILRHFQSINNTQNDTEVIFLRKRSIDNLVECQRLLKTCIENTKSWSLDLVAEDLRLAQTMLLEITGKVSNDQILEKIFSKFCIGK